MIRRLWTRQRRLIAGCVVMCTFIFLLIYFLLMEPAIPSTNELSEPSTPYENTTTDTNQTIMETTNEQLNLNRTIPGEWIPVNDAVQLMLEKQGREADRDQKHHVMDQGDESREDDRMAGSNSDSMIGHAVDNDIPPMNEESGTSDGRVSLNHASLEQLMTLPGIGPSKAQAIIDYRNRFGGFQSLEELMEVKGIGTKTFEKLREAIQL